MTSIPLSSCEFELKDLHSLFPSLLEEKRVHPGGEVVCLRVTRDQPKPGYFLEGGRERTLGTRLTDVRTDGHVTITSQPKFLGLIGYQISLAIYGAPLAGFARRLRYQHYVTSLKTSK